MSSTPSLARWSSPSNSSPTNGSLAQGSKGWFCFPLQRSAQSDSHETESSEQLLQRLLTPLACVKETASRSEEAEHPLQDDRGAQHRLHPDRQARSGAGDLSDGLGSVPCREVPLRPPGPAAVGALGLTTG